jgi:hypothetical protein
MTIQIGPMSVSTVERGAWAASFDVLRLNQSSVGRDEKTMVAEHHGLAAVVGR